jgi:pyruvate dehydrogenase E1 component
MVPDLEVLSEIERRLLWLSTLLIHHANHVRPNPDGVKVGGHQASSASVVSILTALYFGYLQPGDRVSIKPHASPAFHALQYLLGRLPQSALTQLREFGGLQAYPSRTKDLDPVDFSTGSVGFGAVAPSFAALANQYLLARGAAGARPRRFVALLGDAELDEGNVWEALPGGARHPRGAAAAVVHRNRLARAGREVRPPLAGRLCPAGRRGAAPARGRDVQRGIPGPHPAAGRRAEGAVGPRQRPPVRGHQARDQRGA